MFIIVQVPVGGGDAHLPAHVHRDSNDHCRDGNACDESDAHWGSDQSAKLPEDLLFSAPWLLTPKGAA